MVVETAVAAEAGKIQGQGLMEQEEQEDYPVAAEAGGRGWYPLAEELAVQVVVGK
ncbi:MAG: hypothetical protein U1D67_07375 [Dehalococcoidia bacterium]|nr:hypothetical protein [Dehalococcoidia bacterium]